MIPFSRGIKRLSRGIKRRVVALLCAVVMAIYPVYVCAATVAVTAGALTAVTGAVSAVAFLNASRIFPYLEDTDFSQWVVDNLEALVAQYNAAHPDGLLELDGIRAFYVAGKSTLAIARDSWGKLRNFVQWIKDTFALADNQTGVNLGSGVDSGVLSVASSYPPSAAEIQTEDFYVLKYYQAGEAKYYACSGGSRIVFALVQTSSSKKAYYFSDIQNATYSSYDSRGGLYSLTLTDYDTTRGLYYREGAGWGNGISVVLDSRYFLFNTLSAAFDYAQSVLGTSPAPLMTVDTTDVVIPADLPVGVEFGGLQVAELGQGATAQALEDVIEGGVMERQQPVLRPVEVQIQQGVEVDSETGAVTESPVVITPDSVALVSSEFELPAGISTVFPFSVPWDIMRVYAALDAEPAFPEIHASLYVPYSSTINPDYVDDKIPFTIGIPEDMKAGFDAFAAKFRAIALLLACIAVTWAMAKFIRW